MERTADGISDRSFWKKNGIDGDRLSSSGIFSYDFGRFRTTLKSRNIDPEQFGDRIIFMSMFNDIDWNKKNNE